jgi:hypothetical protein
MPRITFNVNITGEIRYHPDTPKTGHGVIVFATRKDLTVGEITVRADEMTLKATVMLTDSEGNPTTADDVPVWEVGDPSVLTVTPAEDGLSATFTVGAPGVSSVTVTTTETHEGEGEPTPIVLSGLVTAVAGDTVTGSVDFTTG